MSLFFFTFILFFYFIYIFHFYIYDLFIYIYIYFLKYKLKQKDGEILYTEKETNFKEKVFRIQFLEAEINVVTSGIFENNASIRTIARKRFD